MDFSFDQLENVGIFTFNSEITTEHEDELKILLMRAIYSIDRAILNFKNVSRIDLNCIQLLNRAHYTSVRLKNPLIFINVPRIFLSELSVCKIESDFNFLHNIDRLSDFINRVICVD